MQVIMIPMTLVLVPSVATKYPLAQQLSLEKLLELLAQLAGRLLCPTLYNTNLNQ
jgi:hypothetical protein